MASANGTSNVNDIGTMFVKQYYNILEKRSDEMHKFYASNAKFSFRDSSNKDGSIDCTGNTSIQDGLRNAGITNANVSVSNIAISSLKCSEESETLEVMVMVSGAMNIKSGNSSKLFSQSFFLSETMGNVMFIVADCLHILSSGSDAADEQQEKEQEKTAEAQQQQQQPEAVESSAAKTETPEIKEKEVAREAPAPAPVEKVAKEPTPQTQPQEQQQPKKTPTQRGNAPAWGPNSKNTSVLSALAPSSHAQSNASNQQQKTEDKAASASTTSSSSEQPAKNASSSSSGGHGPSKDQVERSVYIRDLPEGTKKDEIEDVFSKFGKISLVDLRISKNCAYVEFEDPASAKLALAKQPAPLKLAGKPIEVKERLMLSSSGEGNNSSRGKSLGSKRGSSGTNNARSGGKPKENSNTKAAAPTDSGAEKQKSAPAAKGTAPKVATPKTTPKTATSSSSSGAQTNQKPSSEKQGGQSKPNPQKAPAKTNA